MAKKKTKTSQSLSEKRARAKLKKKNKLIASESAASELEPPQDQLNSLRSYYQSNQLSEANALATQLSLTFPYHTFAWKVLGALAYDQGRVAEAFSLHEKVVKLSPSDAEAHFNLGIMLKAMNRPEEALTSYRRAISLQPQYPDALNNMGSLLLDIDQLTEAAQTLGLALELEPDNYRALNNLGLVYAKKQQFDDAVECYETAVRIKPDFFDALNNLGLALNDMGRLDEAIIALAQAVKLQPGNASAYINFGSALAKVRFTSSEPALYEPINALLTNGDFVRPADVAQAVASLLRQDPTIQDLLSSQENLSDPQVLLMKIESLSQLPLLNNFMRVYSLPDLEIERALTALRHAVVKNIFELASESSIEDFLSSLALQCFINEYIYPENDEEALLIRALRRKLQDSVTLGQQPTANELLCLATYLPLLSLDWLTEADIEQLPRDVKISLITEPTTERDIASTIPSLSKIGRTTSVEVKQQYEENPYPRWTRVPRSPRKASTKEVFDILGLNFAEGRFQHNRPLQILVAGCGTGQQPIEAAFRYQDAQILALDLSTASLAYAQRKTQELGIDNIRYLNADILDIGQVGTRFDIIECSGVLHHMEDPMTGWRALTDQLRPGGLMRIGLYSELARQAIVKVREEIAKQRVKTAPSDIRSFRLSLMSSNEAHHRALQKYTDFYSLSELRDLIFHAQEHRFNILEIKDSLNFLQLSFLGFEDKSIRSKLHEHFGEDLDHRDLEAWHELESFAPRTFAAMYQFWCQKN